MTSRRARWVDRLLLGGAALLLAASSALLADAFLSKRRPMRYNLEDFRIDRAGGDPAQETREKVDRLAKSRMSKAAAKAPPAAPPRPVLPELSTLVRLVGITEFRKGGEKEAIIENIRKRDSKSYRVGERIEQIDAEVRKITDTVLLRYDEKLWILGFEGIREAPAEAVRGREDGARKPWWGWAI